MDCEAKANQRIGGQAYDSPGPWSGPHGKNREQRFIAQSEFSRESLHKSA
jgi:hypothetical protein